MQLALGTYFFPVNGVMVTSNRKIQSGEDEIPWLVVDSLHCDGYLEGVGQNNLTTLQNQFMTVCATPFKDLILFNDDGSRSATLLTNSTSRTGVIVRDGPHFEDTYGSEYAVQRHFKFTAEADYILPTVTARTLHAFEENITISGGGPRYEVFPALVGPPQRQLIYEQTPCIATQSGYAIGIKGYPFMPGPLWPFALRGTPDQKYVSPKKFGRNYTSYRIEWSYSYVWTTSLVGVPNRWPLN